MARFDSEDWVRVGREGGVPLQPVRTPEEALQDPALIAESAVVDVEHPEHGVLRQVGILYGLSETPGRVRARSLGWGSTPANCAPKPSGLPAP